MEAADKAAGQVGFEDDVAFLLQQFEASGGFGLLVEKTMADFFGASGAAISSQRPVCWKMRSRSRAAVRGRQRDDDEVR